MYLDLDNIPFYVGKGKDRRYYIERHLYKDAANRLLKNKIRKVGVDNVQMHFLHKDLTEKEALQQERYWIKYYGRRDLGLGPLCNLTDGGEGTSGHIHTDEAKQKMSEAVKGRIMSNETKQKISKIHKGKKTADETKQKIRDSLKGRTISTEQKKKISDTLKGHEPSKETRQKISKSNKGRFVGEKNPMYGKPAWNSGKKIGSYSDETKHNMSMAQKKRREQEKLDKGVIND